MSESATLDEFLQVATAAAEVGGGVLRRFQGVFVAKEKSPRDLVTDADIAAQQAIAQVIQRRFPDHAFLGEESTPAERNAAIHSRKKIWAVDPLDGTANFVHGLQNYAVSVALVEGAEVLVGVVFDPTNGRLYSATIEGDATLNGTKIAASDCQRLDRAMVACSFPAGVKRTDPEVEQFLRVLERCQSIRRLGSAALNLCYVAQGCLDAYWAQTIQTWDVAAGYLIAKRAGASLTGVNGEPFDLWRAQLLVSCNNTLHAEMLRCLHP